MYKKISPILLIHTLLILYWAWLYHSGHVISDGPLLNLLSFLLFGTLYGYIYGFLARTSPLKVKDILCLLGSFLPLAIQLREGVLVPYIYIFLSLGLSIYYLVCQLKLGKPHEFTLLPISEKAAQSFTLVFTLFLIAIVYLLDLDGTLVHLFIHLLLWVCGLWLIFYLKERESAYEKLYQAYYLWETIARDRDEFARLIHDEIIQDIYAVKNLLSIKSPDLAYSKKILKDLEVKARRIMGFYRSHLFENMDLQENLEEIFTSLAALYPQKTIDLKLQVQRGLTQSLDNQSLRLVCILTKELVNNVYKHSRASYLSYGINQVGGDLWIELESDGAKQSDYAKIQESKGGVLLLKILVNTNSGQINYALKGDVLLTKLVLKGGLHGPTTS